jgi:hypothetical protein
MLLLSKKMSLANLPTYTQDRMLGLGGGGFYFGMQNLECGNGWLRGQKRAMCFIFGA